MVRYYHPDEFADLKRAALEKGFVHVESGPLVRSSYHAHEQADAFRQLSLSTPRHSPIPSHAQPDSQLNLLPELILSRQCLAVGS